MSYSPVVSHGTSHNSSPRSGAGAADQCARALRPHRRAAVQALIIIAAILACSLLIYHNLHASLDAGRLDRENIIHSQTAVSAGWPEQGPGLHNDGGSALAAVSAASSAVAATPESALLDDLQPEVSMSASDANASKLPVSQAVTQPQSSDSIHPNTAPTPSHSAMSTQNDSAASTVPHILDGDLASSSSPIEAIAPDDEPERTAAAPLTSNDKFAAAFPDDSTTGHTQVASVVDTAALQQVEVDASADVHQAKSKDIWRRFSIDAHAPKRCRATVALLHDECNAPPANTASATASWSRTDRVFVRHTDVHGLEVVLKSESSGGLPCVGDTYTAKLTYLWQNASAAAAPGYSHLQATLWAASFDHCNGLYGFAFHGVGAGGAMLPGPWRLEIFHRSTAFRDYWIHTGPLACAVLVGDLVVAKSDIAARWPTGVSVVPSQRRDGTLAARTEAPAELRDQTWLANPLSLLEHEAAMPDAPKAVMAERGKWVGTRNAMSPAQLSVQAKWTSGKTVALVYTAVLDLSMLAAPMEPDTEPARAVFDGSAAHDDDTSARRLRGSRSMVDGKHPGATRNCSASEHAALASSPGVWWPSLACHHAGADGGWPCRGGSAPPPLFHAADVVTWVPDVVRSMQVGCAFKYHSPLEVARHLQSIGMTRFLFLGDSLTRNTLFEFGSFLRGLNANWEPTRTKSYDFYPIGPLPLPRANGTLVVGGIPIKYEFQQVYGAADPPAFPVDCGQSGGFKTKESKRIAHSSHYYHHAYKRIVAGEISVPDILVLGSLGAHDINIGRPYTMYAGLSNIEQLYLLLKSRGFNGPVVARETSASSPFLSKTHRPETQYWAWSYNLELHRLAEKHGWHVQRVFDAMITRPDRFYDGAHMFPTSVYPMKPADFPRSLSSMLLQRLIHILMSLSSPRDGEQHSR